MPSVSKKQHNLMAMVAHDPKAAKRVGISQSVGREFMTADKGKKFAKGGETMVKKIFKGKETYKEELAEAKAIKSGKITPEQYAKGEKAEGVHKMKKGGAVIDGIAKRGKTKGTMVKMCGGGSAKKGK